MIDDITVEELKQKIDAGEKFVFIDVREPHEYEEFNLNATLIPLGTLPSAINDLLPHKDEEIIIHCRSGARSGSAAIAAPIIPASFCNAAISTFTFTFRYCLYRSKFLLTPPPIRIRSGLSNKFR